MSTTTNSTSTTSPIFIDVCNESQNARNTTDQGSCPPIIPGLITFDQVYKGFHGYLSAGICIFGIVTNLLTSIVLMRPGMRTATNLLLTGIAVADTVTMITYTIYTLYLNVFTAPHPCAYPHSRFWIGYLLVHNAVVITSHIVSTVLVVSLAAFRCRTVTRHQPTSTNAGSKVNDIDMQQAKLTILITTLGSIVLCMPNNITRYIFEMKPQHNWFQLYNWAEGNYILVTFIVYGCGVRILACVLITIFSRTLIMALNRQRRSHLRLKAEVVDSKTRDNQRTTAMLVLVVVSFLLTEIPQAVLNTIAAVNTCFLTQVYVRVGDLMDTLVLFNSSLNFILYCTMSKKFRETFTALFIPSMRNQNCPVGSEETLEYRQIKLREKHPKEVKQKTKSILCEDVE